VATPALASGPAVEEFVTIMLPLGMPVESAGCEAGQAATRKLLRSIVMKGVAQLLLEALEAAEAADLGAETWENLVAQLSSIDEALLRRLVTGTAAHAARRVDEMEATVELLEELNVDPVMTIATAARLRRMADGDPARPLPPRPPTGSRPSAEQ
jgi:3-hydroxyisobutyrate dehydrogenase-like beta-hydroxyacid dehydrogenase